MRYMMDRFIQAKTKSIHTCLYKRFVYLNVVYDCVLFCLEFLEQMSRMDGPY